MDNKLNIPEDILFSPHQKTLVGFNTYHPCNASTYAYGNKTKFIFQLFFPDWEASSQPLESESRTPKLEEDASQEGRIQITDEILYWKQDDVVPQLYEGSVEWHEILGQSVWTVAIWRFWVLKSKDKTIISRSLIYTYYALESYLCLRFSASIDWIDSNSVTLVLTLIKIYSKAQGQTK